MAYRFRLRTHARSVAGLMIVIAIIAPTLAAARWQERQRRLYKLAQARLASALAVYQLTYRRVMGGEEGFFRLYPAARTVYEAEHEVDRAVAARAYLKRVRGLNRLAEQIAIRGERYDIPGLEERDRYLKEAEYWAALEE